MRTGQIFVSLVTALILAGGCAPFHVPKEQSGRIGQIKGTITWESGSSDDAELTGSALTLRAMTSGTLISNVAVTMGARSLSSGRVTAPYTVGNLPRGLPIELVVGATSSKISFVRDTPPQAVTLTIPAPTVFNFDFHTAP